MKAELNELVGTAQVAAQRGCAQGTVSRIARQLKLGTMLAGHLVFTPAEAAELCQVIEERPGWKKRMRLRK